MTALTPITLPTAAILADALPRDRSHLDATALTELRTSIARSGLRQPIEVFATDDGYALISGLRRLTAVRQLHDMTGHDRYTSIAAFLRTPADIQSALAAMIEENDIRAELSPWDKGRIALETVAQEFFPTLDAAIQSLYPNASRQKRARLRACAAVVEELDGLLTTPEEMPERHLLRLASALRGGFTDLIVHILQECRGQSYASQWSTLLPTLIEADKGEDETPATPTSPARPRRLLHLKRGLIIRREETPTGYALRFSGPEAKRKGLMDDVMDEVERWFQPIR